MSPNDTWAIFEILTFNFTHLKKNIYQEFFTLYFIHIIFTDIENEGSGDELEYTNEPDTSDSNSKEPSRGLMHQLYTEVIAGLRSTRSDVSSSSSSHNSPELETKLSEESSVNSKLEESDPNNWFDEVQDFWSTLQAEKDAKGRRVS